MNNEKKYVGKLSGLLNNPKKELNNKQDKMKELTPEDVRLLIPKQGPTEEQIVASKAAPIQITLMDSADQPLTATSFAVKKDTTLKTEGTTNSDGLCIYNQPEVMTCDIMPCSLEYENQSVELSVPNNATYANIEVKENNMNIIDTDGIDDPYLLAPEGELNKWSYTLENDEIILNYYKGGRGVTIAPLVVVYANYQLNGNIYKTKLKSNDRNVATNNFYMFNGISIPNSKNVKSIIFSKNIDTSNLTNISNMFNTCTSLTSLDISGFNTSNVDMMNAVFSACSSLTSLNLNNFDTSKVTAMPLLFYSTKLESINISSFDTSNVTDMSEMFDGCNNLKEIIFSSSFDTSNVKNMYRMFYGCKLLTSLDLTSFDTHKVTNMNQMFYNCPNLTEILVSRDKWVIPSGCNTNGMFSTCGVDHVTYVD